MQKSCMLLFVHIVMPPQRLTGFGVLRVEANGVVFVVPQYGFGYTFFDHGSH